MQGIPALCSLFPIPVRLDAPTFKKFFTACPPRDAGSADPSRMRQLVAIWTPTSPVSAPPRERRPNSGYRHLPVPPNPSVLLLTARASAFLSGGPAMVCFGPLFQGEAGRLSIVPLPSRRKGYGLLVYSFQGDKCGVPNASPRLGNYFVEDRSRADKVEGSEARATDGLPDLSGKTSIVNISYQRFPRRDRVLAA